MASRFCSLFRKFTSILEKETYNEIPASLHSSWSETDCGLYIYTYGGNFTYFGQWQGAPEATLMLTRDYCTASLCTNFHISYVWHIA